MIIALKIVFWGSLAALVHTYLLYPIIMHFLARGKSKSITIYNRKEELPKIIVLMAAYNEEKVLEEKIKSLLVQDYPKNKLHIYIGSDNSTDSTDSIIKDFHQNHTNITFIPFKTRQGKTGIINRLVKEASSIYPPEQDVIYLMTDASVMLQSDVCYHLIKHFKNPQMAIVDAHMIYSGISDNDISHSESSYLNAEVQLKNYESMVTQKMMGPFGGCYALRSTYYEPVPSNRLVDDFYIAMTALKNNGLAINSLDAKCYESVSHDMQSEYQRKKRIGAGNFQNLFSFLTLMNPFTALGVSFISHKVLRWKGPFFMICMLVSSYFLMVKGSELFKWLFYGQLVWYLLPPLLLQVFSAIKVPIKIMRSITYFNLMNIALLHGFFQFIGGIKTGIWQPVERK